MPDPIAAPAAQPAASSGAPAKPSAAPVKPNPVVSTKPEVGTQTAAPKPESTLPQRFTRKEKIDGKEVELQATEDELWASHRKASTLDRRFEDNARQQKEIAAERQRNEALMARIRDPNQMLAAFMEANPNADPVEVLSDILQARLREEEQLQDPNIRERRRLERELEGFKSQAQKAEETRQMLEQDAAVESAKNEIADKFSEALALTKLPKNDITIELMAKAESTNRKQGWNLTPQQLAKATEKSVSSMIESMLTNEETTDEQLLEAFPEFTKRVHRGIVARFKARQSGAPQKQTDITPRERRQSSEEAPKQRVVGSAEEHKVYGIKGLRTL